MSNVDQIIAEIDKLQDIFLQAKSFFPALGDSLIGRTCSSTADYYTFKGYKVFITTETPITKEFMEQYARIGKKLNESAIVRLFGILQRHDQVGEKNLLLKDLPGYKDIRFCCWIRNVITKTKLSYDQESEDNTKLREELISHYGLRPEDSKEGIPTPVNQIVEKIFEGCKTYLRAKYKDA